ncbi:MAG: hypothetical protein OXU25_03115 [Thaumarchaeota archaeon]|nr:hypothetical protein [Nitrososphaerota archaeon]
MEEKDEEKREKDPRALRFWMEQHPRGGSSEGRVLATLRVVEAVDKKADSAEEAAQKAMAIAEKAMAIAEKAMAMTQNTADDAKGRADGLEGRVNELEEDANPKWDGVYRPKV